MNEIDLNIYYTVQTIPQNLIELMNWWNSSRSPTSTVLFLELVFFFLEVLGVKLVPGIEEGAAVEGSALWDGVATTWWSVPWGGGGSHYCLVGSVEWGDHCWKTDTGSLKRVSGSEGITDVEGRVAERLGGHCFGTGTCRRLMSWGRRGYSCWTGSVRRMAAEF